jgi:flagellar basal-body rod protein FlgB
MKLTGQQEGFLRHMLALTGQRSTAISGNIANLNTPGYLRREVHFETALREALERGDSPLEIQAEVREDRVTPVRLDGNNVVLEQELALRDQNAVLRDTYLTLLESYYQRLDAVIRGGR